MKTMQKMLGLGVLSVAALLQTGCESAELVQAVLADARSAVVDAAHDLGAVLSGVE